MSTCRNVTCECAAAPGHDYCCAYCANVDLSETIPGYSNARGLCACGHVPCHPGHAHASPESRISVGTNSSES